MGRDKEKQRLYMKEYRKTEQYKKSKRERDKKYYEKHRDDIIKYACDYAKRPEVVKKRRVRENSEAKKEQRKKYRKEHKKELKEYNQKWSKENPNYRKEYEKRDDIKEKRKQQREKEEFKDRRKNYDLNNRDIIRYYVYKCIA